MNEELGYLQRPTTFTETEINSIIDLGQEQGCRDAQVAIAAAVLAYSAYERETLPQIDRRGRAAAIPALERASSLTFISDPDAWQHSYAAGYVVAYLAEVDQYDSGAAQYIADLRHHVEGFPALPEARIIDADRKETHDSNQ